MRKLLSGLPILVILMLPISVQAADIELNEEDMDKLVGSWVGDREWQPTGQKAGSGRYERVFLEINKNGKSVITPEKKPNKKIKGPVEIRDGKVFIKFMKQPREFTYSEKDGEARLSTTFQHKADGKPFINDLVFTK